MEASTSTASNKRITLITTAIVGFVGTFTISAISIALPTIGKDLAAEAFLLSWISNCLSLAQTVTLIPAGRLADILGRKKMLIYGTLLFAVSSFLCGIANSIILLIIFSFMQGVFAGIVLVTAVAVLTSVFSANERGYALGINVGVGYAGLTLGPLLGGLLTQYLGWRSIFFLSAFLSLAVAVVIFRGLKGEWADAYGEKFDIAGTMIFVVALVLVIYGFTTVPTFSGFILILVGVLGLISFLWWETRSASPIFNVNLFRKNSAFVLSNLATLINYLAAFATTFLVSLYLQYVRGFSPQTAGLIMIATPVAMSIFAPLAGRFSDKIDPRLLASIGMAVTFVALLSFCFISETTDLRIVIATLAINGVGLGIFSSPNTNAIMGSVEKKLLGVASGVVGTMRSLGMTLSLGIVMILFSIYIGKVQISPENYPAFLTSMKTGYVIYSVLCFVGIFAQLASMRAKRKTI